MLRNKKYISNTGQQYFMCPVEYFRITQGSNVGTHLGTKAVDLGTRGNKKDPYFAPADVICRWIYPASGEAIWTTVNDVICANGYVGKVSFITVHDDNFSSSVGKIVKQSEYLGSMGTKGNATGQHLHIEFTPTENYNFSQNSYGIWTFTNGENYIDDLCYFDDTEIVDYPGLEAKYIPQVEINKSTYLGTPVARNEDIDQIEVLADNLRVRNAPNGEVLGYVNKGIYNSLEIVSNNDLNWHKIDTDMWIAFGDWANWYPKKEEVRPQPKKEDTLPKIIDISHHNNIDKIDTDYVFIKLTEGVGYKDDEAEEYYNMALSQNKKIGLYHVCRFDNIENTPELEAEWFLSQIKPNTYLILDVEPNYAGVNKIDTSRILAWLKLVENKTGVKPLIYINENMENNANWGEIIKYPLWIAKYSKNKPNLKNWTNFIAWQFTDSPIDTSYLYEDIEKYLFKGNFNEEKLKDDEIVGEDDKSKENKQNDTNNIVFKYIAKQDAKYLIDLKKNEILIIEN